MINRIGSRAIMSNSKVLTNYDWFGDLNFYFPSFSSISRLTSQRILTVQFAVRSSGEGAMGNVWLGWWENAVGVGGKGMQLGVGLFSLLRPLACLSWEDIFMQKTYIFCALCPDLLYWFGFFFSDVLCISAENFNDLRLSVFPDIWLN